MALNSAYSPSSFTNIMTIFSSILLLAAISSDAQMVPAVYVFGDSLVDVGNNNYLKGTLVKANYPHNGIDYPGRKATGRFCNGKNAADFLAEKLGLASPPPYLSITKSSNITTKGVSFASGGAGILDGSSNTFTRVLSLNNQIQYYSQVYGDLVQQMGSVEAQKHLSKSLFALVIGSNDLFGYFKSDSSLPRTYTPQRYIDLLILTLKGQLKRLYNLGSRKLLVAGLGPIGCCPSQRNQNKTNCNEKTNSWSLVYNEGLLKLLQELKSEFKDITFSFFNTYTLLTDFVNKPAFYGFTEVKAACCGLGNLNAKVVCLPISAYCNNRNEHLFWDAFHPTQKAHSLFADTILDGTPNYIVPINLRQLVAI